MHSRRSYINTDAYSKGQTDGGEVGIHHGITGTSSMQTTNTRIIK